MQINIIFNPQRAHERWRLLQKEIEAQGLDVMIWQATVMIPAKTGCCKSHKKIIQWYKDHNISECCIGEDDLHFGRHKEIVKGSWQYFLDNKPNDYDMYFAGAYDWNVGKSGNVVFTSTTLYVMHQRFYDTFLSAKETVNIDFWLSRFGKGKYIVCNPMVVRQHDVPSDNNKIINHEQHLKKFKFYGQ